MVSVGFCCSGDAIYVAAAKDHQPQPGFTERIRRPGLYEVNEGLLETVEETRRVINEIAAEKAMLLLAEQRYKDSYPRMAPRVALETVTRLACALEGVSVDLVYPNSLRARLGLSRGGNLDKAIEDKVAKTGRYWSAGRNRAVAVSII